MSEASSSPVVVREPATVTAPTAVATEALTAEGLCP